MRQDITMDLFSNAVFPFTVAASIAVITGFFHASGVSLNSAGDRVSFQRSEEHTSELQSLMRISYAVFCLKKKRKANIRTPVTIAVIRDNIFLQKNKAYSR